MRSKEEIQQLVQQNIDQIKISEFVAQGGWPKIDHIDVVIYRQEEQDERELLTIDILYGLERAGCCFIPGAEEIMRLSKKVEITPDNLKFIDI